MHRGTCRQLGAGSKYWAHEVRRWHGRDQVRNLLYDITMNSAHVNVVEGNAPIAKRETLVECWERNWRMQICETDVDEDEQINFEECIMMMMAKGLSVL